MLRDILNKKERFRDFFADSAKGFLLIWETSRKITLLNLFLFLLQSVLSILSLVILKNLIDHTKSTGISWQSAAPDLLLFAGVLLFNGIVGQISVFKLAEQQQLISDSLTARVLGKAIELDIEYYENPAHHDDLLMAQQQSLGRPAQLISACQGVIQSFISLALLSTFMFMAHWSILILVVLLSIPLAISKLLHGYQQYMQDRESMPAQRRANELFQYLTTDAYAKEVRLFGFGKNFISQFRQLKQDIFNRKQRLQFRFLKQSIVIQFFEIIITTLIYCIIIGGAISGAITIGGLVIYFQVFQRLQSSIVSLFQSGIGMFQNQLYLRHLLKYLATPPVIRDDEHKSSVPEFKEGISIRNLSFTYPQTSVEVISKLNMVFKPGTITAIVGENGSGKSTLIKLLCRLYEADPDCILFENTPITDIRIDELRKNVTPLFQDFGKYYMSVEDNIAPGSSNNDPQKLDESIKLAGLKEKVDSFPKGYKTYLGRTFKNGVQLSGGQWQKVALARMFFKRSNIIILDEPTSSMDPVAEQLIFQNIKKDLSNKIVILITHRLYNLKIADNIYVMENGKIAEHGTFDQLLNSQGAFANIYEKQKI